MSNFKTKVELLIRQDSPICLTSLILRAKEFKSMKDYLGIDYVKVIEELMSEGKVKRVAIEMSNPDYKDGEPYKVYYFVGGKINVISICEAN